MPTVLVVDAASFMRLRCTKILAEIGCTVLDAEQGQQAVDIYRQMKPEAVLLDITLPDMDGLDVLRAIRSVDPQARVTIVTALGNPAQVRAARQAGASDFVVKPFHTARLIEAVQRMLAPTQ